MTPATPDGHAPATPRACPGHLRRKAGTGPGILEALAARARIGRRVALVVAHPDDETIAAGASLRLMPGLLLVHVTDGAPRRLADRARAGFDTPQAYAAARERELKAALDLANVQPDRARLGVPDQDATLHIPHVAARLGALFASHGTQAVLTHAYEGGHPDHDATACAVHLVARRLGLPVFEFAGYHAGPAGMPDDMTRQRFLPGPAETRITLDPEEAALKQAMYDCFHTQAAVLAAFGASVERFRPAPGYDFTEPPHPGRLNYETWGWEMTGARWRVLAGQVRCDA